MIRPIENKEENHHCGLEFPVVACGDMDSSHCVSVIRERGHGLFSSLYSPCWGNSSNRENEGASTNYTWLTLQNEVNNPAAPIYRR